MLSASSALGQLERITRQEAVSGLRTALEKGSHAAVAQLGRTDGFFGNPQVKIPLPDSLTRTEKMLRRVGMGRYADELVLTMNRAAEAAVPEARQLLVDSIRKMTINDAKGILAGGDTAGTEYFRRTTRDPLHGRFLPIVKHATAKVNLAHKYNEYAEKGVALGLVKKQDADVDEQRDIELRHGLHQLPHFGFHFLQLVLRHFQDQLIVHLHDEHRAQFSLFQETLNCNHRKLDQVGGGALHRRVDRGALGRLAAHRAAALHLRQPEAPAEHRFDVALRARAAARLVHVAFHPRIAGEIRLDVGLCRRALDAEVLRQAEARHAVDEPEVDNLRGAPLVGADLVERQAEYLRGSGAVHVVAALERALQVLVV